MTAPLRIIVGWMLAYAATECVVVAIASVTLALTWPTIIMCAIIEGAVLGALQGVLLFGRRSQPVLTWTLATIAGVLAGRAIEFCADSSPLSATLLGSSIVIQVIAGVALGLCVGAAMGFAQAFALPNDIRAGYRWVGICSVAWALTLPALLLAGRMIAAISDLPGLLAVAIAFALFATLGALVGLFEGAGLALIMPRFEPSETARRDSPAPNV
jgi:hypothetical protein